MLKLKSTKEIPGREAFLVNFSSKSRFAESYRTLRTNITFSLMEKEVECLLVTSSLQEEGKSISASNLGFTIAQTGKKVLLVDGDLRRPGLTTRFSLDKADGLSNLLGDTLGNFLKKGNINEYGLQDIITLNRLQKRTCIMEVCDDINEVELFFLKGSLVDVYWKNRPDSKKLASTLIKEKLLTHDEARLALGHQKKSVRRLGTILLTLALVKEKELKKILSVQIMEAVKIAFEMESGIFSMKSISEDQIPISTKDAADFSQLLKEMLPADETTSYIKESIDKNILETDEKNLYILPSGVIPPNPSELLGSERTAFLLLELKKKFDVVIIDSSPIMPATDALLLAPLTDGVVLVVEAGKTNRNIVKEVTQKLKKTNANILGVLLNRADFSKGSYYNYKYYDSYYGD